MLESWHAASPPGPRRACFQPSVLPPAMRTCGLNPPQRCTIRRRNNSHRHRHRHRLRGEGERRKTATHRACSSTAPSSCSETVASKPPFFCHCNPLGQCPPWAVYLCKMDPCWIYAGGGLSVATSVMCHSRRVKPSRPAPKATLQLDSERRSATPGVFGTEHTLGRGDRWRAGTASRRQGASGRQSCWSSNRASCA